MFIVVSENRISEIVQGRRRITAYTALRLGCRFGASAEFWMNLKNSYELCNAAEKIEQIQKIWSGTLKHMPDVLGKIAVRSCDQQVDCEILIVNELAVYKI